MSVSGFLDEQVLLSRFESYLIEAGFPRVKRAQHLERVQRFLAYLKQQAVAAEAVTPAILARYLRVQWQRHRRRHGRPPRNPQTWRHGQSGGIHRFLAVVQGRWPPQFIATNDRERSINTVLMDYQHALRSERLLAGSTVRQRVEEAGRFLRSIAAEDLTGSLVALVTTSVDQYIKGRAHGMARSTCRSLCGNVRAVLQFLHATGRLSRDLASAVIGPSTYRFEGLPSTISPEQVRTVLTTARQDRSARGLRDYAILMLLATYGLRAGEICELRLDDIDWRSDRLWIRHTKTGARSCLPLLPSVGHALLDYLRRVRPPGSHREVFIRMHAPRCALLTHSAVNSLLRRHLARIGIRLQGKRGPHVFRHARAASLLKAGVPLKTVGDVLGHRSAEATAVYLKLDDRRLRDVALSLPLPEVSP